MFLPLHKDHGRFPSIPTYRLLVLGSKVQEEEPQCVDCHERLVIFERSVQERRSRLSPRYRYIRYSHDDKTPLFQVHLQVRLGTCVTEMKLFPIKHLSPFLPPSVLLVACHVAHLPGDNYAREPRRVFGILVVCMSSHQTRAKIRWAISLDYHANMTSRLGAGCNILGMSGVSEAGKLKLPVPCITGILMLISVSSWWCWWDIITDHFGVCQFGTCFVLDKSPFFVGRQMYLITWPARRSHSYQRRCVKYDQM